MELLSVKWIVVVAVAALLGLALLSPLTVASDGDDDFELDMTAGPFAPGAEGEVEFSISAAGVLSGEFESEGLPDLGHHAFYVLWFVRPDPGGDPAKDDKAFLGPISDDDSILSLTEGELSFGAPHFTTGPSAGMGIELGAVNVFVLIAEDRIDTVMPFPITRPDAMASFALIVIFGP